MLTLNFFFYRSRKFPEGHMCVGTHRSKAEKLACKENKGKTQL